MECLNVHIISLQLVTHRFYANECWLIATELYKRIPTGFSLKFCEGSQIQKETHEESWQMQSVICSHNAIVVCPLSFSFENGFSSMFSVGSWVWHRTQQCAFIYIYIYRCMCVSLCVCLWKTIRINRILSSASLDNVGKIFFVWKALAPK